MTSSAPTFLETLTLSSGAERLAGWLGIALGAALLLYAVAVNPIFTHADELGHLVVSRDAWTHPALIFNIWGRTVNTLMFMPVAHAPLSVARAWAVLMNLISVGLAWSFGRRVGLRLAWLVPLFIVVQPLFLDFAWGAVTHAPFQLCFVLTAVLAQRGRWRWAALVAGLLPLVRHEGIALTAAFGGLLLLRREWRALGLLALPVVLTNLLAWVCIRDLPFRVYFAPKPTTFYGSGPIRSYARDLLWMIGPLFPALALFGLPELPRRPVLLVYTLFSFFYFALHALIFKFGLYASGGYISFLMPLAPCAALLAVSGLEALLQRLHAALVESPSRYARMWAELRPRLLRGLLFTAVFALAIIDIRPRHLRPWEPQPDEIAVHEAVAWLRETGRLTQPIVAVHTRFFYETGQPVPHLDERLWIHSDHLADLAPGTLVLWDAHLGETLGLPRATLEKPENRLFVRWSVPQAAIYEKQ